MSRPQPAVAERWTRDPAEAERNVLLAARLWRLAYRHRARLKPDTVTHCADRLCQAVDWLDYITNGEYVRRSARTDG